MSNFGKENFSAANTGRLVRIFRSIFVAIYGLRTFLPICCTARIFVYSLQYCLRTFLQMLQCDTLKTDLKYLHICTVSGKFGFGARAGTENRTKNNGILSVVPLSSHLISFPPSVRLWIPSLFFCPL